jgi:glutamine amidotransferase
MRIAIIDYGSGNLRSAHKAFERVIRERGWKAEAIVTPDARELADASHIVLPGVGAFGQCSNALRALPGMIAALEEEVRGKKKPFLGICVGMQLMMQRGFEHGEHEGLGWIEGDVVALEPGDPVLKVPHMGWNELVLSKRHPAFEGIAAGDHAYFVHSFEARCRNPSDCLAEAEYGGRVTAVIGRDNLLGMQFHPEKSQKTGLTLIGNFLAEGSA